MYCQFYGFSEKPFEVTPDPRYLYLSPSHREMLASLVYGINERRGFIAITGEVGTGKTTLINAAIDRLGELTKVAYICNTSFDFDQILHQVVLELGHDEFGPPLSKFESIQWLNDLAIERLSRGGNVVVFVDEAQNLDQTSLENLRLLSNLETRKHKLIQIVLSGQVELDAKLRRPDLRQLSQRINVRRSIDPLTEKETGEYIRSRLELAGYKGSSLFDREAQQLIFKYSGGIPRRINILCDNALLIGFGLGEKRVKASMVEEAAGDLRWTSAPAYVESPLAAASPLTAAPPLTAASPPMAASPLIAASPLTAASPPIAASPAVPVVTSPVVPVVPEPRRLGVGTVLAAMFAFTACLGVGVWAFLTYSGYTLKLHEPAVVKQSVQHLTGQGGVQVPTSEDLEKAPEKAPGAINEAVVTQGTEVTASEAVLPLPSNAARSPETNVAPAPVEAQNGGSKPVERPRVVNPVQDAIKRMFSD